jgi:hypothetical protein
MLYSLCPRWLPRVHRGLRLALLTGPNISLVNASSSYSLQTLLSHVLGSKLAGMASVAFPALAKKASLSDGTVYGYVAAPPTSPDKPTFLFLHGYPSSSYDWRHQIRSLPAAGYGVVVPDLLGYGDTDAPAHVGAYRLKAMAQHMAEILDREGVSRCIAVSHDW